MITRRSPKVRCAQWPKTDRSRRPLRPGKHLQKAPRSVVTPLQGAKSHLPSTEYRVPSTEYRVPSTEYRVPSTGPPPPRNSPSQYGGRDARPFTRWSPAFRRLIECQRPTRSRRRTAFRLPAGCRALHRRATFWAPPKKNSRMLGCLPSNIGETEIPGGQASGCSTPLAHF
jgi:hypothetical protein